MLAIIELLAVLDLLTDGIDFEETISKLIRYSDTLYPLKKQG